MRITIYCLISLLFINCKDRYLLADTDFQASGTLVVEGFINFNGPTSIKISRTTLLSERKIDTEKNAAVVIEGDDNTVYPLIEQESGEYKTEQLPLNINSRYRLKIKTANNKEYASDYSNVIRTPAIDSLSWTRENGVNIFVNSNGEGTDTRYYRWDYEETWEFTSTYRTNCTFVYDTLPGGNRRYTGIGYFKQPEFFAASFNTNDSIYRCWRTPPVPYRIQIGTTEKLSSNIVYSPIRYIPENAWELSEHYSLKAYQYGMSKECYTFYSILKKNTESLGSIFDAMPSSDLKGNIKCLDDTTEVVIGFIEPCEKKEKRFFIRKEQVPGWTYVAPCRDLEKGQYPDSVVNTPADVLSAVIIGFLPVVPHGDAVSKDYPFRIYLTQIKDKFCVDCTLSGTSTRPDFWPPQ